MGAGMADQKNLDAQFGKAIMGDGKFEVRLYHSLYVLLAVLMI